MFDELGEYASEINPMSFLTAAAGLLMGIVMMKFGGLQGLGVLGKLGMIVGSTLGGFIAGAWIFKE